MTTTAMARGTIVPTTTGVVIFEEPPPPEDEEEELEDEEVELESSLTTREGICSCRSPPNRASGTPAG
jgi:hypothetical protein